MLAALITAVSLVFLVQLAVAHRHVERAFRRREGARPPPLSDYPPVTVIRPVKGTDVEQAENFRAALDTGYPGAVETIFVFEDEDDPAFPLARHAIETHRGAGGHGEARVVFAGKPPTGRTGKINNMIAGAWSATGEFIAFGDSDSRPDTKVLQNVIQHMVADPKAGAGFAPPITPGPIRTAGDVGHDIIMNALLVAYMEAQMGPHRELPFLMGQLMVFRREALQAIGGVECADGQLVDDMFLGARIVDAGYRNVLGTHPLHIINYDLGFSDFVRLWRRWLFCGRGGMPFSFVRPFVIRAVSTFSALGLAVAALAVGPVWATALPALLLLCEGLHYIRLHRLQGGAPVPLRHAWMVWMPYAMAIPIGISMLLKPELDWRGHTYRVDFDAKLQAASDLRGSGAPEPERPSERETGSGPGPG
jgi:ceramide glucosyltransferase